MLYLLEGHDMLGFVNESSPDVPGDEWKRWDVLVRGWILGSLSEHTSRQVLHRLKSKQTHFTAKHVWEQLRHMYGQQVEELEKERKEGSYAIDPKEFVEEERNRSRVKQDLYLAVECGKLQHVLSILQHKNIGITDSISINGNTALHIAVSNSDGFLHSMLELLPSDIPLKDVKNMDGSTLLHLAASCGNTNAAKILVGWSRDLLNAKDNQGFTPFDIILSQPMNKEMCLFFMKQQAPTTIAAHETLLNAISYKHFDLALAFIKKCNSFKSRAVLMAIAQNFPVDFTLNQLIIYELFRTPILQFITRGASDKKGYMKFADLVLKAGVTYPYKFLIRICMKLQVFKDLEVRMKEREDAKDLLDVVCALMRVHLDGEGEADTEPKYSYTEAMLEAIRRDASDVVDIIVHWFPEAALTVDEYGHNVAQIAWKNRAYKIAAISLLAAFHSLALKITITKIKINIKIKIKTKPTPFLFLSQNCFLQIQLTSSSSSLSSSSSSAISAATQTQIKPNV
ncbi:hypothetical protein QVD17_27783 [Tagetes erecta]|uniref:Uncharacterized protein n=1 Tax=Tagetes erecta TaxID=13708 RepID=A0AAD8NRX3_TARER|nr:hypothetical protein QVD17_27783 [Tagetes erecta]